jgi:hypothetical protein
MASSRAADLSLAIENEALRAENAALKAELVSLRPRRPPEGWVCVKAAEHLWRCSGSVIYKWAVRGRIRSTKIEGCVWVDPTSFLPDKLAYRFTRRSRAGWCAWVTQSLGISNCACGWRSTMPRKLPPISIALALSTGCRHYARPALMQRCPLPS